MNADDRGGGDRSFTQLAYAPFGGAPGAAGFGLAVWPTHAPGWPDGAPVQPRWIPINGFAPPCTPFAQLQRANAAPAMTAVWPAGGAAAWANEPTPWPAHAGVARASSAIIVDPRCVRPKRQTVVRVRVGHDDALAQALSAGANCASAAPLRAESPSAALEPGCCGTHARELPLERGALLRAAESVGIAQPHGRDDTSGAHGDASSKHTLAHVGFPTLRPTAVASAFPPRTAVHDSAWTAEEDGLLERAIREEGKHDWAAIARRVFGRTDEQCRARSRLHAQPNATHAPLDASADAGKDAMGCAVREQACATPQDDGSNDALGSPDGAACLQASHAPSPVAAGAHGGSALGCGLPTERDMLTGACPASAMASPRAPSDAANCGAAAPQFWWATAPTHAAAPERETRALADGAAHPPGASAAPEAALTMAHALLAFEQQRPGAQPHAQFAGRAAHTMAPRAPAQEGTPCGAMQAQALPAPPATDAALAQLRRLRAVQHMQLQTLRNQHEMQLLGMHRLLTRGDTPCANPHTQPHACGRAPAMVHVQPPAHVHLVQPQPCFRPYAQPHAAQLQPQHYPPQCPHNQRPPQAAGLFYAGVGGMAPPQPLPRAPPAAWSHGAPYSAPPPHMAASVCHAHRCASERRASCNDTFLLNEPPPYVHAPSAHIATALPSTVDPAASTQAWQRTGPCGERAAGAHLQSERGEGRPSHTVGASEFNTLLTGAEWF
ncbi:hypothetical protein KFE25_005370 [Diacronema lutheri]|uniref:Uncharacterized protein n=2 Tax=Diacronema lutheri TaxID=2081491 RepID=A0A8J6CDF4_DIALT|nr:hypothetical protein KFE25_005370 [Diacronema lutheri]